MTYKMSRYAMAKLLSTEEQACAFDDCYSADECVRGNALLDLKGYITALQAEADALRAWKESALAVEASWDAQAVARLLEIPLGADIRAAIQPAIEKLKAERDALREALQHQDHALTSLITSDLGLSSAVITELIRARTEMRATLVLVDEPHAIVEPIGVPKTTRALAVAAVDALFNARSGTRYDVAERALQHELDIEDESHGECAVVVQAISLSAPPGGKP